MSLLRGHLPLRPSGGLSITDVRDLAKALAAAMTSGKGPRRYLVGGHFVSFAGLADLLARVTGRRLPGVVLPADLLLPALHGVDMFQRVLPIRLPVSRGGAWVIRHSVPLDSSRAEAELGYAARPLDETVADTVRAVVASGHLAPRLAGRLQS